MDFDLSPDQATLHNAVAQIVAGHAARRADPAFSYYDAALDRALVDGGFFGICRAEGCGPLDAALLVEQVSTAPGCVEVAASALVLPQLADAALPRPVALVGTSRGAPVRYLPVARTALALDGRDVVVLEVAEGDVVVDRTPLAYPYGHFERPDGLRAVRRLAGAAESLRQWWQVSLAAETAGAMRVALDLTVEYVKQRRQFNRPLGSFQAIQHRLAECATLVNATRWLALRAAWTAGAEDAALAAMFAQDAIAKVAYDLHQFNGAMGLTLEQPLHLWTYRLRALQGELDGPAGQAADVARRVWGEAV